MVNYYEVLQVVDFAEIEVINASYRALAKKYHPDINKVESGDMMVKINAAYEVLSDITHKEEYDKQLRAFLNNNQCYEEPPVAKDYDASQEYKYQDFTTEERSTNKITKVALLTVRIPISIIVAFLIGTIGSYLIMLILDYDSSWLYFLYVILGSLIGGIIGTISGCENSNLAIISAVITIIVMVAPHSLYIYDSFYSNYESMGFFFGFAIKEIWWLFMQNGFIRAIFTILAPIAAAGAVEGSY